MSRGLSIREVAARTGVAAATLRMWEQRHGFPVPNRLPSGHRRYSEDDVDRVRRVARHRDAGIGLGAAIDRVRWTGPDHEPSIFAGVRRRRPDLQPYLLPKRSLVALSHAIEDECCARAERPLLFGSFQRVRFWHHSKPRWRELARTARAAVVFADFDAVSVAADGDPIELPIDRRDPFGREWSIVCDAPGCAAFLAGWERPGQEDVPDLERRFETLWSVEAQLVREVAAISLGIVRRTRPDVAERLAPWLDGAPAPAGEELRRVAALTNRMVAYLGAGAEVRLPEPHSSAAE